MDMVEKVARAIAVRNGDDYDKIPKHKSDWTSNGGMFGGRFRDVNEPYQTDYDDMAEAALEAMRKPTQDIRHAVWRRLEESAKVGNLHSGHITGDGHPDVLMSDIIDAALTPTR